MLPRRVREGVVDAAGEGGVYEAVPVTLFRTDGEDARKAV